MFSFENLVERISFVVKRDSKDLDRKRSWPDLLKILIKFVLSQPSVSVVSLYT